jgi:hypothetical protein
MNTIARICWISSPVYLLVGMAFGMWMAATGNEELRSAHAHLNLIGGVMMAIFGAFYTLFPNLASTMIAKIQVAATHLSVWLLFPGVIMVHTGQGDTLAKIGGTVGFLAVAAFLVIVARAPSSRST